MHHQNNLQEKSFVSFQTGCNIIGYASAVGQTVSIVTLAVMSIDQWILVHRALTYHLYINQRKIIHINNAIWIISFLLYTPFFFGYFDFEYIVYTHLCLIQMLEICNREANLIPRLCLYVLSFLIIVLCNVWTCGTAHKHMKKIQTQESSAMSSDRQIVFNTTRPTYKHFKTTVLIITGFILTSGPLFFIQMIFSFSTIANINKTLLFYAEWSMISGSYINFFVCIFTNRMLRETLKKMFLNSYKKIKITLKADRSSNS